MFPPGRGNDILNVGQKYVISIYGTNEVFTAEGVEVRLREYKEDDRRQIWICSQDKNSRFGMQNEATRRFIGRKSALTYFACAAQSQRGWESLYFTRLSMGGYSVMVINASDERLHPLQRHYSNRAEVMIGGRSDQLGLHQLEESVVRRFEWVVPQRLARSSAPYYDSEDSDQSMNETSIEFLMKRGINRIISLNEIPLSSREKGKLKARGISYTHVKVPDFAAPTQSQFDQIRDAYAKGGVTLIYCGYGDGRTGMAISALQIFQGRKLSHKDYRDHGVQSPSQLTALDALSIRIHGVEDDSDSPSPSGAEPPPYAVSDKAKVIKGKEPKERWKCKGLYAGQL
ncbi:hypothetical protein L873DRAFT_1814053 [Choiromyces venosus 120613-1]|uniref:Swiss Army Knife protein DSP-PTPase phosphatase domain-containing protein n=1 Tax=Choiromyces venosus 120613-1 TaxID=1336337 RepID=A0A3N4JCY7_9PEZI|nr:hypothetical protein L873DRAFT_1814053 [Choiromyces venosus 120613-1]